MSGLGAGPASLVSIVVVAYNSAATLSETLASITSQQYPRLEVLICDDGSSDATMQLAQDWSEQHGARFERVVLLGGRDNQGICLNLAKGYAAALGKWLKPIAADDILLPQAITNYVACAEEGGYAMVVSCIRPFSDAEGAQRHWGEALPPAADQTLLSGPSEHLLTALLRRNFVPAPGVLLERAALVRVGGVDLDFKHLDDWPLWIRMLQEGCKVGFWLEPLVDYRVSALSISAVRCPTTVNPDLLADLTCFYRKYQKPNLPLTERWDHALLSFRLTLARGVLRPFPRLYRLTAGLRLLSPSFWRAL